MSVAFYFQQKCTERLKENITLTLRKLSDPASLIQVDASESLKQVASGDLGVLGEIGLDLIEENAERIFLTAMDVVGLGREARDMLDLVFNILSAAVTTRNDLVIIFLQRVAQQAINELERKQEVLHELKEKLRVLHNALVVLVTGDPVFNQYIERLRQALLQIESAKVDLSVTRSTLQANNRFLFRRFDQAKSKLRTAKDQLAPKTNTPYFEPSFVGFLSQPKRAGESLIGQAGEISKATLQGAATEFGIPTTEQQLNNILAIPRLSKQVLSAAQGYFESTAKANALIAAFIAGLNKLQEGMSNTIKGFTLRQLTTSIDELNRVVAEMSSNLNGDPGAIQGPVTGFRPNASKIPVLSYKWTLELANVLALLDLVPRSGLINLELSNQAVAAYRNAVLLLQQKDSVRRGNAVLSGEDGQEQTGQLEQQLVVFVTQANAAIISGSVKSEILSLSRAIQTRLDLSLQRDQEIITILRDFTRVQIPSLNTLNGIADGIFKLLKDLGFDQAHDFLKNGNFDSFFRMNAKTASYVGAALTAIAFLQECLGRDDDLVKVRRQLERDRKLLSLRLSIDFDLSIFKNLQDCLRFGGLAELFLSKELLCGLLEVVLEGKGFKGLNDLLNPATKPVSSIFN